MEKNKTLSYTQVVVLGFLVYFFSYAMRLDYAAAMISIVSDLNLSNTTASSAVTGCYIAYAVGQLFCGTVGDRISPFRMISLAMLGTILINIAVSFCSNIVTIAALWCINGICQAMLWPSLARFVTEQVEQIRCSDAITIVNLSPSAGTMFVYLTVPLFLKVTHWRNVFRIMSALGTVILAVWIYFTRNIPTVKKKVTEESNIKAKISVWEITKSAGLIPICIIIILHGILRDGIQTWLPSLVKEQFGLSESSSVLSTAVLPVLSMASVIISNILNHRIKNEIKTATVMFGVAFVFTLPLAFGVKIPAAGTIAAAAVISACMHGVNHMMISIIPQKFLKYGMVSTFSGLLNCFTYIGSSLSTYGFAAAADRFGWRSLFAIWLCTSAIGTVMSGLRTKKWTEFTEE